MNVNVSPCCSWGLLLLPYWFQKGQSATGESGAGGPRSLALCCSSVSWSSQPRGDLWVKELRTSRLSSQARLAPCFHMHHTEAPSLTHCRLQEMQQVAAFRGRACCGRLASAWALGWG